MTLDHSIPTTFASRSLPGQFARAVSVSIVYAPIALTLAVLSTVIICVATSIIPPTPDGVVMGFSAGWLVAGHAVFIAFMTSLIARAGLPMRARIAGSGQAVLRGALPLIAVLGLALGLGFISPFLSLAAWAVMVFFALPAHFAANGLRGLFTAPAGSPVSAVLRIVLLAPSAVFLSVMTAFLSQAGDSWGIMDGGVFTIPLLALTTFWAAYSCALFSAQFAAASSSVVAV